MKRFDLIALMPASALCVLSMADAAAQSYPTRPVRFVVAAAPGGTPDILARILAPKLTEQLGQPVIVDNRPGATGNIGADVVAKAQPDGYTILMATSVLAISPAFYKKLPFDAGRDLAAVSQVASQAMFLFVQAESPVKSVAELITLAKSKSGRIAYASFGNGSPQHVATELLQIVAGIKLVHVPYKSGGLMVTALLSGEVQTMFLGLSPALPHVKAGRFRTLAVASAKRPATAPEVPTFAEAGMPEVVVDNWLGVLTTAGVQPSTMAKLNAEVVKAVRSADVAERIVQQGVEINTSTPQQFASFVRAEIAKWAKVVGAAGIDPQ